MLVRYMGARPGSNYFELEDFNMMNNFDILDMNMLNFLKLLVCVI